MTALVMTLDVLATLKGFYVAVLVLAQLACLLGSFLAVFRLCRSMGTALILLIVFMGVSQWMAQEEVTWFQEHLGIFQGVKVTGLGWDLTQLWVSAQALFFAGLCNLVFRERVPYYYGIETDERGECVITDVFVPGEVRTVVVNDSNHNRGIDEGEENTHTEYVVDKDELRRWGRLLHRRGVGVYRPRFFNLRYSSKGAHLESVVSMKSFKEVEV